jgi:GDP-mannose 6-dehydrogenase
VDLSPAKVEALEAGRSLILEERVAGLIADCRKSNLLHVSDDVASAVLETDISFLCVGTPQLAQWQA